MNLFLVLISIETYFWVCIYFHFSFFYSFRKHFLRACCVLGTVLGSVVIEMRSLCSQPGKILKSSKWWLLCRVMCWAVQSVDEGRPASAWRGQGRLPVSAVAVLKKWMYSYLWDSSKSFFLFIASQVNTKYKTLKKNLLDWIKMWYNLPTYLF